MIKNLAEKLEYRIAIFSYFVRQSLEKMANSLRRSWVALKGRKFKKRKKVLQKMTQKKSFRIESESLKYLQTLQEKMQVKSLSEALNLLLFFLRRDEKLLGAAKENYQLLQTKHIKITDENIKEVKIFLADKELETLKKQAKQNGFSTTNKFAKFLILNHLYDEKILSNDTINEFAKTNSLIKRIGINLSLFVRSIQQDSSAYFVKDDLLELAQQIKNQAKETSDFLQEQKQILRVKLR